MKPTSLLALLLIGLLATYSTAQERAKKVDPSGTWRFEYELEGLTVKDSLELQLGKEGAVTGIYKGRAENPIELSSGKIDGDQIELEMAFDFQGLEIKVKFEGKVKEDDIEGLVIATTQQGDMDFDWIAKRSVEPEDVVGTWDLEIDAVETVLEPTLEIKLVDKELKGTYKDQDTGINVDVSDLRIVKNELKFTISSDFQGTPIKAHFSGRPYGSKISGTVEYDLGGDTGEVDFEGVKQRRRRKPTRNSARPQAIVTARQPGVDERMTHRGHPATDGLGYLRDALALL